MEKYGIKLFSILCSEPTRITTGSTEQLFINVYSKQQLNFSIMDSIYGKIDVKQNYKDNSTKPVRIVIQPGGGIRY